MRPALSTEAMEMTVAATLIAPVMTVDSNAPFALMVLKMMGA